MHRALLAVVVLLVAGCATTRGDAPAELTWDYPGTYKRLATCTYEGMERAGHKPRFMDYEGKAKVWTVVHGLLGDEALNQMEIMFIQADEQVTVEYWQYGASAKRVPANANYIKKIIDSCAGSA